MGAAQSDVHTVGVQACDASECFAVHPDVDGDGGCAPAHDLDLANHRGMTILEAGLQRDAPFLVLSRPRSLRCCAGAETELEATGADLLHGCRGQREHFRMPVGDVRHQRADADGRGDRGERTQKGEGLQHIPITTGEGGPIEVIEHPRRVVGAVGLVLQDGVAQRAPVVVGGAVLNVDDHLPRMAGNRAN